MVIMTEQTEHQRTEKVVAPLPESQRSLTEIIVAATAGAIANPVMADVYQAAKTGIKAGVDKITGNADPPPPSDPAE
jgi:hypothetical protein